VERLVDYRRLLREPALKGLAVVPEHMLLELQELAVLAEVTAELVEVLAAKAGILVALVVVRAAVLLGMLAQVALEGLVEQPVTLALAAVVVVVALA
jgi:hypothetical protein